MAFQTLLTIKIMKRSRLDVCDAEMTMGQRVIGQMGQRRWMGHVGHGSELLQ